MGIIKTYAEFINESVWGDIYKRGAGEQIRKEEGLIGAIMNSLTRDKQYGSFFKYVDVTNSRYEFEDYFTSPDVIDLVSDNVINEDSCDIISVNYPEFYYNGERCVPYHLFVPETSITDQYGDTISLFFEFGTGEDDDDLEGEYISYCPTDDSWGRYINSPEDIEDEFLKFFLCTITPIVNPKTKFK